MKDVRDRVTNWYHGFEGFKGPLTHYCLFWAGFTVQRLKEENVRACLQAGSAFWRCIRREEDDGKRIDSYGYKFEWNSQTLRAVIAGELPEVHVWVAVPNGENSEVIDLTSGFFKERCIKEGHIPWTAEYEPPPYLWVRAKDMPEPAHYEVNRKATEIAYQYWHHSMTGGGPMVFNFTE